MLPALTLEEAVKVLDERLHHGHAGWFISGIEYPDPIVFGIDQYEFLDTFEAIAIAEEYRTDPLREATDALHEINPRHPGPHRIDPPSPDRGPAMGPDRAGSDP